ncbi:MAG: methyltransferase domain-containing protein [Anaerolineaceae bacterium]
MDEAQLQKAALRGNPSYVWREGQERRLNMILTAAGERTRGTVLVDGCGVGMYLHHLEASGGRVVGMDIELERANEARGVASQTLCGAGEHLPFPSNHFDLILSHEVLEHVQDDSATIREIVRTLRPGGRLVLFCPNRGYPYETHGIYWCGKYHFGNIPLVNYLPRRWRDRLAPHVNVYTRRDLERLFAGLPVRIVQRTVIASAYDNIIARRPALGHFVRAVTRAIEHTPLHGLGLSHFWVVEKISKA